MAYNSKFKHNESTDGIGVSAKFRTLFKDKYSFPRKNIIVQDAGLSVTYSNMIISNK